MTPVLLSERPTALIAAPIEDATRREFITGVGAAALAAAFLAACGDDRTAAGTPELSETIDFTYEDITTTIPRNPQRVVVMEGRGDLDFALSVGYPVIATGSWNPGEKPAGPFAGHLDDAQVLPNMYPDPDYELLATLQPDLIVQRANAYRGDFYGNERLAQVAPVLSVECNRANWRTDLEQQAILLGRDREVAEQLAEYDEAVGAARDEVGELLNGRTVALLTVAEGFFLVWTSNFATEIANDIGMVLPFRNSTEGETYIELTDEHYNRLEEIDLLLGQGYADNRERLKSVATWTRLPSVQAGRVGDFPGTLNNGMALTAKTLVEVLVESARLLA